MRGAHTADGTLQILQNEDQTKKRLAEIILFSARMTDFLKFLKQHKCHITMQLLLKNFSCFVSIMNKPS